MPTAQVKPCTAVCLVTCAISPAGGSLVRQSHRVQTPAGIETRQTWAPSPTGGSDLLAEEMSTSTLTNRWLRLAG